jgi:hypothetical protein
VRLGPIAIGGERPNRQLDSLTESLRQYDSLTEVLQERIADLELALEDVGWQRVIGDGERDFTRDGLRRLCALSFLNYLKNPLIGRGVTLQAAYVFGQGVTVQSADEATNEAIQAFWDDPRNQAELTSGDALLEREQELAVFGNLFFVLFSSPAGEVVVRSVHVDEIDEIVCNPEDAREPWYYKRVWSPRQLDPATGLVRGRQQVAYYPDWRYNPPAAERLTTIAGAPVLWDSPVKHVKVGALAGMRFGVPETYRAMDWAKAYKEFLEDRATVARALSRFAWSVTASGGQRGVQAAKARLATSLGTSGEERNPPPLPGSTFIGSGDSKLQPVSVAGATIDPDEGRRFLLMVCAATGLPETFFGDVSVGTLATARSLDRPTELKFRSRQKLWEEVLKDILGYAVQRRLGALARGGVSMAAPRSVQIDVDFPPLLEHDVTEQVNAVISAATLDGKALAGTLDNELLVRLLLTALGVDDIDEIVASMADRIALLGPSPDTGSDAATEAYRELTEALRALKEAAD